MNARERVTCGVVGSVIPLFATLSIMPQSQIWASLPTLDIASVMGLVIKVVSTLIVGGAVCYFREQISNRWSAFVLGALAVGMFSGALAVGGAVAQKLLQFVDAGSLPRTFAFITPARADALQGPSKADSETPYVYPICTPQGSQIARFVGGLTGVFPDTLTMYWVVAPLLGDRDAARTLRMKATGVSSRGDRKPRMFAAPTQGGWKYVVSLGLNLSKDDSNELAASYSKRFGIPFTAVTYAGLLQELSISPAALPICHFTHDEG